MKIFNQLAGTLAGLAFMLSGATARAEEFETVNAFYFGNSLTENTMVGLHPLLGKSAGKTWNYDMAGAPGAPSWFHMNRFMNEPEGRQAKTFADAEIDAMVVLIFGGEGLSFVTQTMWGNTKFDQPTDVGDVATNLKKIKGKYVVFATAWNGAIIGENERVAATYDKVIWQSDTLRGPYEMPRYADCLPVSGHSCPVQQGPDGRWYGLFFGNDSSSPWWGKPGVLIYDVHLDDDGYIHFDLKDERP